MALKGLKYIHLLISYAYSIWLALVASANKLPGVYLYTGNPSKNLIFFNH